MRNFVSLIAAGCALCLMSCGGSTTQSKLNDRIVIIPDDPNPPDDVVIIDPGNDDGRIPTDPVYDAWVGSFFNNTGLKGTVSDQFYYYTHDLSFNWGAGSYVEGQPVDNFSARFERTVFLGGTIQFKAASDDGIRAFLYPVYSSVSIDKSRRINLFNDWTEHGLTNYSVTKNLPAGEYRIVVEYFERGGGAALYFSYNENPDQGRCNSDQWTVKRFSNINMTGPAVKECSNYPADNVSVNWGSGMGDNWSAVWTRQFIPSKTGEYKFFAQADDALEVLVDGQSLVWSDLYRGVPKADASKHLNAGQSYKITLKYRENTGDASLNFKIQLFECPNVTANILTCVRPWSESAQNRRVEICQSTPSGDCIGSRSVRTSYASNGGVIKIDGFTWNSCSPAPYYKVVRFQDNDPNAVWVGQLHPGDVRTSFWCD